MKKSSTLKKVTIAAIVLTFAAMVLELIFVRALKIEYESLIFSPVRLITLISANMLGGCIFTKILKSTLLARFGDSARSAYKKISIPTLWAGAFLILLDCLKDTFLHPEATTVSSALISVYLFLAGISSLLIPKDDPACDKAGYIGGAVIAFILSALALTLLVLSAAGDIVYLLNK